METRLPAGQPLMSDPVAEDRAGILCFHSPEAFQSPGAFWPVDIRKPVPLVCPGLRVGRGDKQKKHLIERNIKRNSIFWPMHWMESSLKIHNHTGQGLKISIPACMCVCGGRGELSSTPLF